MHQRNSDRERPRWRYAAFAVIIAGLALVGVANLDVTTKQGLNFEVSTHRIPLYLKAFEFIERSARYRQIADEVTSGAMSDTERALKVFEWTRRHIRTTPPDWPIVDDHILHIIIRGHGFSDQQADVFATLLTYAGVPAFWAKAQADPTGPVVILSFARIDDRWRVFDVFNGVVFRSATGGLATMNDLRGHPELLPASARSIEVKGVPYGEIVTKVPMPAVPNPLRAELQMPSARLWYQLKVAVRLTPEP